MIQAVSNDIARQGGRHLVKYTNNWRTNYIGKRTGQIEDAPQAYLVEMCANGVIPPHFHQVDQFQVLVAGNGTLGRNAASLIALHYADHHTAYGPINAGPCGLSLFTIRGKTDPGAIHLDNPGYKDLLNKPTKKRYLLTENIGLSTEPVLQNRSEISLEQVLEAVDSSDGLGALMLRMGPSMKTKGPDPQATGGQFYIVLNGSLQFDGASYPVWSTIYAGRKDAPLELCAGPQGLEALVLNFPRSES